MTDAQAKQATLTSKLMIFEFLIARDENVKRLLEGTWKCTGTVRDGDSLHVCFHRFDANCFMGTSLTVWTGNQ